MTSPKNVECVEELLGSFLPIEPSNKIEERVLKRTFSNRTTFNKKAVMILTVSVAACICFGIFVWLYNNNSSGTNENIPAKSGENNLLVSNEKTNPTTIKPTITQSDPQRALFLLSTMRKDCEEIDEMLEVVPVNRSDEKERISRKISNCLKRVSQLEQRVRYSLSRSERVLNNRREVNV